MKPSETLLHIYTYTSKLCEAKPGDIPMLEPRGGSNCAECLRRSTVLGPVAEQEPPKKQKAAT